jgi:hypothetical protein
MSLNPDNWTDKTQQTIREAKDLAAESSHVQLNPVHIAVRIQMEIIVLHLVGGAEEALDFFHEHCR